MAENRNQPQFTNNRLMYIKNNAENSVKKVRKTTNEVKVEVTDSLRRQKKVSFHSEIEELDAFDDDYAERQNRTQFNITQNKINNFNTERREGKNFNRNKADRCNTDFEDDHFMRENYSQDSMRQKFVQSKNQTATTSDYEDRSRQKHFSQKRYRNEVNDATEGAVSFNGDRSTRGKYALNKDQRRIRFDDENISVMFSNDTRSAQGSFVQRKVQSKVGASDLENSYCSEDDNYSMHDSYKNRSRRGVGDNEINQSFQDNRFQNRSRGRAQDDGNNEDISFENDDVKPRKFAPNKDQRRVRFEDINLSALSLNDDYPGKAPFAHEKEIHHKNRNKLEADNICCSKDNQPFIMKSIQNRVKTGDNNHSIRNNNQFRVEADVHVNATPVNNVRPAQVSFAQRRIQRKVDAYETNRNHSEKGNIEQRRNYDREETNDEKEDSHLSEVNRSKKAYITQNRIRDKAKEEEGSSCFEDNRPKRGNLQPNKIRHFDEDAINLENKQFTRRYKSQSREEFDKEHSNIKFLNDMLGSVADSKIPRREVEEINYSEDDRIMIGEFTESKYGYKMKSNNREHDDYDKSNCPIKGHVSQSCLSTRGNFNQNKDWSTRKDTVFKDNRSLGEYFIRDKAQLKDVNNSSRWYKDDNRMPENNKRRNQGPTEIDNIKDDDDDEDPNLAQNRYRDKIQSNNKKYPFVRFTDDSAQKNVQYRAESSKLKHSSDENFIQKQYQDMTKIDNATEASYKFENSRFKRGNFSQNEGRRRERAYNLDEVKYSKVPNVESNYVEGYISSEEDRPRGGHVCVSRCPDRKSTYLTTDNDYSDDDRSAPTRTNYNQKSSSFSIPDEDYLEFEHDYRIKTNFAEKGDQKQYTADNDDMETYTFEDKRPDVKNFSPNDDYEKDERKNTGTSNNSKKINEMSMLFEATNCEEDIFDSYTKSENIFTKFNKVKLTITGNNVVKSILYFQEAKLHDTLFNNILKSGYQVPTPIQKATIPIIMAGRDVMACAQSGSGKTAGYLLPILHNILTDKETRFSVKVCEPQGLILSPTRELAIQISEEARKFANSTSINTKLIYGGASVNQQTVQTIGPCNILVATPGRLRDFLKKGLVSFVYLRYVVLDEADRMLDLGFIDKIEEILTDKSMAKKCQISLFSATFPEEVQRLGKRFLKDNLYITPDTVGSTFTDIKQIFIQVDKYNKYKQLQKILNQLDYGRIIIFVSTKRNTEVIAAFLSEKDLSVTSIHGDRLQREREKALRDFKTGSSNILVATDVAARGLDIKNVDHVLNYDLPTNINEYIHRIGRTGRVGNSGRAISFYDAAIDSHLAPELINILQTTNQHIPSWLKNEATQRKFDSSDESL